LLEAVYGRRARRMRRLRSPEPFRGPSNRSSNNQPRNNQPSHKLLRPVSRLRRSKRPAGNSPQPVQAQDTATSHQRFMFTPIPKPISRQTSRPETKANASSGPRARAHLMARVNHQPSKGNPAVNPEAAQQQRAQPVGQPPAPRSEQ